MEPFLCQGGHVLTFNWAKIKKGDVVVFKSKNKYMIKRTIKISSKKLLVLGDNRTVSLKIGPVNLGQIVGRVILKY